MKMKINKCESYAGYMITETHAANKKKYKLHIDLKWWEKWFSDVHKATLIEIKMQVQIDVSLCLEVI